MNKTISCDRGSNCYHVKIDIFLFGTMLKDMQYRTTCSFLHCSHTSMAKVVREKREWKDVVDNMIYYIGTFFSLIFSFLIAPAMASCLACQYHEATDNNTLCGFQIQVILDSFKSQNVEDIIQYELKTASNYEEWRSQAQTLDM